MRTVPILATAAIAVLAVALFVLAPRDRGAAPVTVFAAASLADAIERFAAHYRADTGRTLRSSFAASSTLARQIDAGSAADIFVSASEEWTAFLEQRGRLRSAGVRRPVGNRLVVVAPRGAGNLPLGQLEAGLGRDGRLAVGDPAHVPAGRYAQSALESLGVWRRLEPRLARADNVRAALALVARREAPLGIVYATDGRAEDDVVAVAEFPAALHPPIVYQFALVGDAPSPAARDAFEALTGAAGIAVFEEFGFVAR